MSENVIPVSYAQWRECIEVRGGIRLTADYVSERLSELEDSDHARTREFVACYGPEQLQRTIEWFRRALSELPGT